MGEWRLAERYSVRDSGVGMQGGRSPAGDPTPLSRSQRAAPAAREISVGSARAYADLLGKSGN